MKWFDINKYKIFPDMEDWTSDMNKYRYEKNVNKLTYKEWFWFHPSAYSFISYGLFVLPIFMFSILAVYFVNIKLVGLAIIPILAVVILSYALYKRIINRVSGFTFYDLYMREYIKGDKNE